MAAAALKVGLVQLRAEGDDRQANLAKTLDAVRVAAGRGAKVICLQELFAASYFCQTEDWARFELAEPIPGPSSEAVARVARELGVVIVASLFERRAPGLHHNTSLVIGPDGSELGRYRKMHIPDDPQFLEKFYFAPGDLGFVAVKTPWATLGPLVCWDQWYPEAARLTALKGAEILVYPTAIGWMQSEKAEFGQSQLDAWKTMQRSHAIANGTFVVAVNRVGQEPGPDGGIEFWGHSFVADPMGRILCEAGEGEEVLVADCDLSLIGSTREIWPFFRDRRIDAYVGLDRRWLGDAS